MDAERAETHLRLLAEAELRHAVAPAGDVTIPVSGLNGARIMRVAQALISVNVLDAEMADAILADFDLAVATRQPVSRGAPIALRPPGIRRRIARLVQTSTRQTYSGFAGAGASATSSRPAGQHEADRTVPVGMMIPLRDKDAHGELYVLAYSHTASGSRFTVAAWLRGEHPARIRSLPAGFDLLDNFTATDDRGDRYTLGFSGGGGDATWAGLLKLNPDPPSGIRWLDLTAAGSRPRRISLDTPAHPPAATSTGTSRPAGEHLLDVTAAQILTQVADQPPGRHGARRYGDSHLAVGLGDVIEALQAAGALSPLSAVPGQLATLCESLDLHDHGIVAPPAAGLPKPWLGMLAHAHRRKRDTDPPREGCAGAAVTLPEVDGVTVSVLGLHADQDGTILHLHASGVALEPEPGLAALPLFWLLDDTGRWHTTTESGWSTEHDGELTARLRIVPPLTRGTSIDIIAAGQSAEVRVTLTLVWR